ncbi:amino acid ABC transporter, periplasmic cysteine-binding protein [Campylobacter blaseri]|uniref:Solute-binding protein family 3/N-terminal domain-containing protein n=1 Tax=Campylobacter blaseri TaxID=2042961 RepID=A0A2P8QYQ7_9BACT|nr:transporter substrate-binding domain-containing protein [Campylobacter blaseri]PSM51386.1 hypothetical protein CQ405_08330 [Campylobacter blaseri]PSM52836.1 hypothetical protein CRN67_08335 [Campylobacter blaseri]QKF86138.1 amino acid ABC transporter, periplasmic cysteine-binding protein [Campylobacter blaseri]
MKKNFVAIILALFSISCYANTIEQIISQNEIRIGVRNNYPPFSKFDGHEFTGFEVEFAKEIAKKIAPNAKITLVGLNAKDRIPFLNENKIDMAVAQFSVSPDREKYVDFTMPYFALYKALVTEKSRNIKAISQLTGGKILAIKGTGSRKYIEKNFNGSIVDCENLLDCFEKLKNNEADGYFHSIFALASIPIIDNKYEISVKNAGQTSFVSVGVDKGNESLKAAINRAILELSKEGFFKTAYDQTLGVYYKGTLDKKLFLLDDIYNFFSDN